MRILLFLLMLISLHTVAQSGPSAPNRFPNRAKNVTFNHQSKEPLGVDLMAGDHKGLTVYGNPSNDHIIVSMAGAVNDRRTISIISTYGQRVFYMGDVRENTYLIEVGSLPKGIYAVEVKTQGKTLRSKWIKQ